LGLFNGPKGKLEVNGAKARKSALFATYTTYLLAFIGIGACGKALDQNLGTYKCMWLVY
jgi:hypothetical protein